jgi:hypothetical protein
LDIGGDLKMVKFITGTERDIEHKINEALKELPKAKILSTGNTPRGCMLYAFIEHAEIKEKEDGGSNDS